MPQHRLPSTALDPVTFTITVPRAMSDSLEDCINSVLSQFYAKASEASSLSVAISVCGIDSAKSEPFEAVGVRTASFGDTTSAAGIVDVEEETKDQLRCLASIQGIVEANGEYSLNVAGDRVASIVGGSGDERNQTKRAACEGMLALYNKARESTWEAARRRLWKKIGLAGL